MKKQKRNTGSAAVTVIKTILIYTVLTAALLFGGTRIFGILMNGTAKAEAETAAASAPAAEKTAAPSAAPTIAPTPTPTPTVPSDTAIGTITIGSSEINVRNMPSTAGQLVTTVHAYSTCQVYETTVNEGYTWYRISENEWVPDGGNWLTYKSN